MAKYRKAIYLDAVPKEKKGKEGYELTSELGVVSWQNKAAFEATYILCPKKVAKKVIPKPAEKPAAPKPVAKKAVAKKK
jgi:hypothetical protein